MFAGHTAGAVLLMGGEGVRFGSSLPKQLHLLGSKSLYRYALDTILACKAFDSIVLVCHPDTIAQVCCELEENGYCGIQVVLGGRTRQESSFLGIQAFVPMPNLILIHDAVRPFVTQEILFSNLAAAIEHGAADTCIPSADTLVFTPNGNAIESIPNRSHLQRGQTPQTFRSDWIIEAHSQAMQEKRTGATDDCSLVLAIGKEVAIVSGSDENFKITSPFDLLVAERLCEEKEATRGSER